MPLGVLPRCIVRDVALRRRSGGRLLAAAVGVEIERAFRPLTYQLDLSKHPLFPLLEKGQDSFVTSVTAKKDAALLHLKTFRWQLPWSLKLDDGVVRYLVTLHEHEVGAPPVSEEELAAAAARGDDDDDEE